MLAAFEGGRREGGDSTVEEATEAEEECHDGMG